MNSYYDILTQSLATIAHVTCGYAAITTKNGIRLKTVDSNGYEIEDLKGVYYEEAAKAYLNKSAMLGSSQLEPGVEAWFLPIDEYILCCSNIERIKTANSLKKSLINALPFISRVAGGEAVVFDKYGRRISSVDSNGKINDSFLGKASNDARKSMKLQKPIIGESSSVPGAYAVRIPIGEEFGFGFNNEDSVSKNKQLLNEVKKNQNAKYTFDNIIGNSRQISKAKEIANMASNSNSSVLIYGETGTGKEVFAQSIHNASERCGKPFIAINCAAIPEQLIESSFMGYVDGAFTGAKKGGSPGIFERANGGTVFLDEIGEMNIDLQSKILRVLQEREVTRIGGSKTIKIDVRIISATNRNLEDMIKDNKFRQDLYYRLNVLDIGLPSLRHMKSDIPLLIMNTVDKMNKDFGKFVQSIDSQALDILCEYSWPGNIRELINCVEKIFNIIGNDTEIKSDHIPINIKKSVLSTSSVVSDFVSLDFHLAEYEKEIILNALKANNNIKSQTAKYLKISTTSLWRKIKQYNISI